MENQRTLLYVSLAMVLFLVWNTWQQDYGPKPVAPAETQVMTGEAPANDIPSAVSVKKGDIPGAEMSAIPDEPVQSVQQPIHVVTDKLDVIIDSKGGTLSVVRLRDYPQSVDKPDESFLLFGAKGDHFFTAQSGIVSAASKAPSHHAVYRAEKTEYQLEQGQDDLTVKLVWAEDGVQVTKIFTFHRGRYLVDVEHQVKSNQPWSGSQYTQLVRAEPLTKDNQFIYTYTGGVVYNEEVKYEKINFSDMAKKELPIDGPTQFKAGWAAMIQHYFLAAWVPDKAENNQYYTNTAGENRYVLGLRSSALSIQPGEVAEFKRQLVVGPKLQGKLEAIAPGLELTVDYGFLTIIAKPLYWLLGIYHDWVGNWGWAIIFLTITVKVLFYKLSEASYRSMAKMRKLGPRLKSLKERFGDDRQGMSKAMMDMYKTEKINPLGGCFPMLVQIPVFIALYWVLLESVEMRNAPFALWLDNLSAKDPYFVLPLLMGISMFVQFKLNPAPMDPIQKKVFQFMPIVFTVFFAFFPSGLVLYWVVNNILSITQQYIITKRIEAGEAK
jgi:YidC/Oxa1 family membrane protein insertase